MPPEEFNPAGEHWIDYGLGDLGPTLEEETAIVAFMKTLSNGYEPEMEADLNDKDCKHG